MTTRVGKAECEFNVDEGKCLKIQSALGIPAPSCEPDSGRCNDVRWEIVQYELSIERTRLGFVAPDSLQGDVEGK